MSLYNILRDFITQSNKTVPDVTELKKELQQPLAEGGGGLTPNTISTIQDLTAGGPHDTEKLCEAFLEIYNKALGEAEQKRQLEVKEIIAQQIQHG